jgi:hypothetical protein
METRGREVVDDRIELAGAERLPVLAELPQLYPIDGLTADIDCAVQEELVIGVEFWMSQYIEQAALAALRDLEGRHRLVDESTISDEPESAWALSDQDIAVAHVHHTPRSLQPIDDLLCANADLAGRPIALLDELA